MKREAEPAGHRRRGRPGSSRPILRYIAPIAASFVVIVLVAWILVRVNDDSGATSSVALTDPGGATVAGLHADVRVVPDERVEDVLARHGVTYTNGFEPITGGSSVVVRLDWTAQPTAPHGSRYVVVVLDENSPVTPGVGPMPGPGPGPLWTSRPVTMGWDGRLDEVAARYPWLTPAVDFCDDSGCSDRTTAAFLRPQASGPLWIVARFPAHGAYQLRPGPVPDPLVGVILTDADMEPLWADRLYG